MNKFILGTVQLGQDYGINNPGGKPSLAEAQKILSLASKAGITLLDTADAYGESQKIIWAFQKENSEPFEILSKFTLSDPKRKTITACLEGTLNELGASQLECYSFHLFKDLLAYPATEAAREVNSLKSQGKMNSFGVSIYGNDEFKEAIDREYIDVIQFPMNLLDNFERRKALILEAKKKGKTLHCRSIYLQGLFFKELEKFPAKLAPLKPAISSLQELAKKNDLTMGELALLYGFQFDEIDGVLVGVESASQLAENIKVLAQKEVPAGLFGEINRIEIKEEALLAPSNW